MSDTLTSLLRIAWKVALALTAVKCAHYVVRRISSGRMRLSQYVTVFKRNAQLNAEVDEARRAIKLLREHLQQERDEAHRDAELSLQEIAFWRRMEELARREILRKDEALSHTETLLEAQNERLQLLDTQLRESILAAQERERMFVEERDTMRASLDAVQTQYLNAQRLLEPPDACSDMDVVQMVRNMNLEISRTATLLTGSFHVNENGRGDGFAGAYERTKEAVGPIMAELLESIHHEDDPILVHIALQADIVGFASGIVSAWDFQHQSNSTFSGIHRQMLRSETQSVTGRWRALTRQYSKQRLYNGRDLTSGFTNQLAERLCDILTVAGSSVDHEQIRQSAYQNLETIIRLALELQELIGEKITSRDLEIVIVRVDDIFDPEQMEDVYDDEGHAAEEQEPLHVLCTAALGLRRCQKPADGLGDELQLTTLVKPKVVLETLVYELGLVEDDDAAIEADDEDGSSNADA